MLRVATILAGLLSAGAAWAQAAEIGHAITGATDNLLDKGVLGTVALIGLAATGGLAWGYNALWTARLADARVALSDAKAAAADLREANKEMAEALNSSSRTSAALTVAIESHGREAERRHADLKDDLGAIQDVKTVVASNAAAMARIEADVRNPSRGSR